LRAQRGGQAAALDRYGDVLDGGDTDRGRQVFQSQRVGCVACHRAGDAGGRVGPDLSSIGRSRARRDLLESVLIPSASFARGFESFQILTADSRIHVGILTRETPEAVYVRTTDQRELRIPRRDIDEMQPSQLSIMPAGLENTMTRDQLRDLLAYLESLR